MMSKFIVTLDKYFWVILLVVSPALLFPNSQNIFALAAIPFAFMLFVFSRRAKLEEAPDETFDFNTIIGLSLLLLAISVLLSIFFSFDLLLSLEKISGVLLGFGVYLYVVRAGKEPIGWWATLFTFFFISVLIGFVALFSTNWPGRISFLGVLTNLFRLIPIYIPEISSGLQHNAVGGTLLWAVIPMWSLVFAHYLFQQNDSLAREDKGNSTVISRSKWISNVFLPRLVQKSAIFLRTIFVPETGDKREAKFFRIFFLVLGPIFLTTIILLTQSRSSYLGFIIGVFPLVFLMGSLRVKGFATTTVIALFTIIAASVTLNRSQITETSLLVNTLDHRMEIWSRALMAIRDFPLTGVGMNSFRALVGDFYPLFIVDPRLDIAHAHNEFLQAYLDLGILGFLVFTYIQVYSILAAIRIWQNPESEIAHTFRNGILPTRIYGVIGLGLGMGLLGHMIFGLFDAITLGSKPGVLWWMSIALVFALRGEHIKKFRNS